MSKRKGRSQYLQQLTKLTKFSYVLPLQITNSFVIIINWQILLSPPPKFPMPNFLNHATVHPTVNISVSRRERNTQGFCNLQIGLSGKCNIFRQEVPRRSESSLRFHIGRSSAKDWSFSKRSWRFSMRGAHSFTISPMLMKG